MKEFTVKINVDESITAILKIKEEMDSIEFLGLLEKAKKIFGASGSLPTRKYNKTGIGSNKDAGRTKKITDEEVDEIKSMKANGLSHSQITEEFNNAHPDKQISKTSITYFINKR